MNCFSLAIPKIKTIKRNNTFTYPLDNLTGRCCNKLLNNQQLLSTRRAILSRLPFLKLKSDITNVVYLNWLVDLEAFKDYIPKDLIIKRINNRILFTALTYQHGHFGPSFLGSLRTMFPSPLQSNWRLYPEFLPDATSGEGIVFFLKNILNNPLYTAGSRLLSDALPSHLTNTFEHTLSNNEYRSRITAGCDSSPELFAVTAQQEQKELPTEFTEWFPDWEQAVAYIGLQHSAIAQVETINRLVHAGIKLPIDTTQIQPLKIKTLEMPFLDQLKANASAPFAFLVPSVKFEVLWEHLL